MNNEIIQYLESVGFQKRCDDETNKSYGIYKENYICEIGGEKAYSETIFVIDKHIQNEYSIFWYDIYYSHREPGFGSEWTEYKHRFNDNYEPNIKDIDIILQFFNLKNNK